MNGSRHQFCAPGDGPIDERVGELQRVDLGRSGRGPNDRVNGDVSIQPRGTVEFAEGRDITGVQPGDHERLELAIANVHPE